MSQQGLRQASFRSVGGTTGTYEQGALACFAVHGITVGTFNECFPAWINSRLTQTYTDLPRAMAEYAKSKDSTATNWSAMGTFRLMAAITAPIETTDDFGPGADAEYKCWLAEINAAMKREEKFRTPAKRIEKRYLDAIAGRRRFGSC